MSDLIASHWTGRRPLEPRQLMAQPVLPLGDIRYFNFLHLVGLVLQTDPQALRDSQRIERVCDSFDAGPWIDLIPDEFGSRLIQLGDADLKRLSADWFRASSFGHFSGRFEPILPPLVRKIHHFSTKASEGQMSVFFCQYLT